MINSKMNEYRGRLKRRFDEILAKGNVSSLGWLAVFSVVFVAVATVCGRLLFSEDITWQWVVARFLDAGNFRDEMTHHDITALIITLLGVVVFSTLLVGVCVNIFESIADAVRDGKRRYSLKNHILVLGSSKYLKVLQNELKADGLAGHKVVVMCPEKQPFQDDYIYYEGCRFVEADLRSACAAQASKIYILGDDGEENHDDKSLRCLKLLKKICAEADHQIKCLLLLREQSCAEVFQYLKLQGRDDFSGQGVNESKPITGWTATGKNLLVDVLNEYECFAEMLLVNEAYPFLPVIKENDEFRSHVIIMGFGPMAQALAYTVAHMSHYPNFKRTGKKTCITFVGRGAEAWMDELVAARPGLFDISKYTCVGADGSKIVHESKSPLGDFLDVEWEFIDAAETSSLVSDYICKLATEKSEILNICMCHEKSSDALKYALHLPRIVYAPDENHDRYINIAVYSNDEVDSVVRFARKSGMYSNIRYFGNTEELWKYSGSDRIARGQRVNYIYSRLWDGAKENDTPEDWWYIKSEADKSSSIYSANFITLRKICFEGVSDNTLVYEAEHRRWMMATLLLGFFSAPENINLPKEEKKRQKERLFRHFDIIPYDALPVGEKEKDKVLVDAESYILGTEKELNPEYVKKQ